MPGLDKRFAY